MNPPPHDRSHSHLAGGRAELRHHYGPRVHLASTPYAMSLLATLCSPETRQPLLNELIRRLYEDLLSHVVSAEFPLCPVDMPTRMATLHPEARYRGLAVDPDARAVCVNIARAGTLPSQTCYETLNFLMNPAHVRQDHVFMERRTDKRCRVTGVNFAGSKIGGPLDGAVVLVPDPMGATGSSLLATVRELTKHSTPAKIIAMHLIVTPEALRAVKKSGLPITVYAIRLDRGLSSPEVLRTVPGTKWAKEKGLNATQYIVPGAGGVGELLNNAEH
ncbi:MAG: uracil phosphoribosyltransferase [Planctomycetes bacterium]|nr:uracil phosphoribosyltransferase [Planctomycetota bacterium]